MKKKLSQKYTPSVSPPLIQFNTLSPPMVSCNANNKYWSNIIWQYKPLSLLIILADWATIYIKLRTSCSVVSNLTVSPSPTICSLLLPKWDSVNVLIWIQHYSRWLMVISRLLLFLTTILIWKHRTHLATIAHQISSAYGLPKEKPNLHPRLLVKSRP